MTCTKTQRRRRDHGTWSRPRGVERVKSPPNGLNEVYLWGSSSRLMVESGTAPSSYESETVVRLNAHASTTCDVKSPCRDAVWRLSVPSRRANEVDALGKPEAEQLQSSNCTRDVFETLPDWMT